MRDSMYGRCDMCDLIAFDPKPCGVCFTTDRGSALCAEHRHTCANCGESMCPDHSDVVVDTGESVLWCRTCTDAPICSECDETILPGQPTEERDDEAMHKQCAEHRDERIGTRGMERRMNGDNGPSDEKYRAEMIDAGRSHLLP